MYICTCVYICTHLTYLCQYILYTYLYTYIRYVHTISIYIHIDIDMYRYIVVWHTFFCTPRFAHRYPKTNRLVLPEVTLASDSLTSVLVLWSFEIFYTVMSKYEG